LTAQPRLRPLCQPRHRRCPRVRAQVGGWIRGQEQGLVWYPWEALALVQALARAKARGRGLGQGQELARGRARAKAQAQAPIL
jgi:hypothetical protein